MFLLMNIGCIECGVSSAVVGIFASEEEANTLANKLDTDKRTNWREGGQNSYEVFELPAAEVISEEYLEVANG